MAGHLDTDINVKSVLGQLAIIALLLLIADIWLKSTSPSLKIPGEIFIGAAVILGFIISIGIYSVTGLGLIPSFTLGYIPAFLLLALVTPIGVVLLLLDLLALFAIIVYSYERG